MTARKFKIKPIDIVLEKLFSCIGETYSFSFCERYAWHKIHSWTEDTKNSYVEWMSNYIHRHVEAQRQIMKQPSKSLPRCRTTAEEFVKKFGWKLKE